MDPRILWYGTFIALAIWYLAIQLTTKDKRYFIYFLSGALLGFYFDLTFTSVNATYPDFYFVKIFGLPLSMTIAEGFSVAIVIHLFETAKRLLGKYL